MQPFQIRLLARCPTSLFASDVAFPLNPRANVSSFPGNGLNVALRKGGEMEKGPGEFRSLYKALADFTAATRCERHGVELEYTIFQKAGPPSFGSTYDPLQYDLRLRPDTAAVDSGCVLPNVNDDYTGEAPDLGCYEMGQALPLYGPRNKGKGSFILEQQ